MVQSPHKTPRAIPSVGFSAKPRPGVCQQAGLDKKINRKFYQMTTEQRPENPGLCLAGELEGVGGGELGIGWCCGFGVGPWMGLEWRNEQIKEPWGVRAGGC